MDKGQPTSIGQLRWLVTLANRVDSPVGSANLDEMITPIAEVHANITPVSLQAFIGSEQIDTPITHRITIRWQNFANIGMFNVILRHVALPDGSVQQEIYRIRRAEEFAGRHRYIICDAELERFNA